MNLSPTLNFTSLRTAFSRFQNNRKFSRAQEVKSYERKRTEFLRIINFEPEKEYSFIAKRRKILEIEKLKLNLEQSNLNHKIRNLLYADLKKLQLHLEN